MGTMRQIFTLRTSWSSVWNSRLPIKLTLLSPEKAFDSVIIEKPWTEMQEYGFPSMYINIIRDLYDQSSSCVLRKKEHHTGVRKRLRWNLTTFRKDLDYADDIALLASRHSDMQEKTSRLHDTAEVVGLSVNPSKTKTMRLNRKRSDSITVEGNQLEDVEAFTYLGAMLDKQSERESDIKQGLALVRNAFASRQPLWESSKYSSKTKLHIRVGIGRRAEQQLRKMQRGKKLFSMASIVFRSAKM
ncbi:uncharacterized protein LOC144648130 [Oculina patagonica]